MFTKHRDTREETHMTLYLITSVAVIRVHVDQVRVFVRSLLKNAVVVLCTDTL